MGNVLSFAELRQARAVACGPDRLLRVFAQERHRVEDVRWLKENAELLRLLVATGRRPDQQVVQTVYGGFAASLMDRLCFFPQYYRFFLSIALDLEELGVEGVNSIEMVEWAMSDACVQAELSDLQRAEARLMAQRVGVEFCKQDGLTERLLSFASRAETFALPNRKASYELTHIAFYLSDYGRHGFAGSSQLIDSLLNAGLISYIENNSDLLSEICIALRYCGSTPPVEWELAVRDAFAAFKLSATPPNGMGDEYHTWLMAAWSREVAGEDVLTAPLPVSQFYFLKSQSPSTLLEISVALMDLGAARTGDWAPMRARLAARISRPAMEHMDRVAASTPQFEEFFASFARAPQARRAR